MTAIQYYGVAIPPPVDGADQADGSHQESVIHVYTEKADALRVLKENKGARFKAFRSEEEAKEYAAGWESQTSTQPKEASTPIPGESCAFKSLKSQETVKFRKAIESNNLDFMLDCIKSNPRYLVTSSDSPTILQEGPRHNGMHAAAKAGRVEAAKLILNYVEGGSIMRDMYPDEDSDQNRERSEHLLDLYLNMPDKGGGDTPLHLAAKFGHLAMVELLADHPALRSRDAVNKFGETPMDVVCSRVREPATPTTVNRIRELIRGQVYIPIFKESFDELDGGPSTIGQPMAVPDTASLMTSWRSVPPSTGMSSPYSPAGNLNLLNSSVATLSPRSPLSSRGWSGGSDTVGRGQPVFLSALLGPVPQEKASQIYQDLKRTPAKDRLKDPSKGLERQGCEVAKQHGSTWKEFWPFLDEYVDLAADEGLVLLENHLAEQHLRIARLEEEARCSELDDDPGVLEDTNVVVQMGEMEFTTGINSKSMDSNANVSNERDSPSSPLSPMSSLVREFSASLQFEDGKIKSDDHLDNSDEQDNSIMDHGSSGESVNDNSQQWEHPGDGRTSPSEVTYQLVSQFSCMFGLTISSSMPTSNGDQDLVDWVLPLLPHWDNLRRQVNNMRSDPQGRWTGLDYSALLLRLLKEITREIENNLDNFEISMLQHHLERLGSLSALSRLDSADGDLNSQAYRAPDSTSFRQPAGPQPETRVIHRLKVLQPFIKILHYFFENRKLPANCDVNGLWNIPLENSSISTDSVNRARRFLHTKVLKSDVDNASHGQEEFAQFNDYRLDNGNSLSKDDGEELSENQTNRIRHDSACSSSSSQFITPPSSVFGSPSGSSTFTAEEGRTVWIEGDHPSQTDRQVKDALRHLSLSTVDPKIYPNVVTYISQVRSFSEDDVKKWPMRSRRSPSRHPDSGAKPRLQFDDTM